MHCSFDINGGGIDSLGLNRSILHNLSVRYTQSFKHTDTLMSDEKLCQADCEMTSHLHVSVSDGLTSGCRLPRIVIARIMHYYVELASVLLFLLSFMLPLGSKINNKHKQQMYTNK